MGLAFHTAEKSRFGSAQRSMNHIRASVPRSVPASQDVLQPQANRCACGGSCPRCAPAEQETSGLVADTGRAPAILRAQISSAAEDDEAVGTTEAGITPEADEGVFDGEGIETLAPETPLGGDATCPVTAVFSSMLAGMEKAGCQVPEAHFGVSRLARFRLQGLTPGSGSLTIQEQFTKIDDPCELFPALRANSYTTSQAIFDDCYMLASKKPLPDDCTLTVEQNHRLNGKVISKNRITFGPKSLRFCTFPRLPGSCDFSNRCKK